MPMLGYGENRCSSPQNTTHKVSARRTRETLLINVLTPQQRCVHYTCVINQKAASPCVVQNTYLRGGFLPQYLELRTQFRVVRPELLHAPTHRNEVVVQSHCNSGRPDDIERELTFELSPALLLLSPSLPWNHSRQPCVASRRGTRISALTGRCERAMTMEVEWRQERGGVYNTVCIASND